MPHRQPETMKAKGELECTVITTIFMTVGFHATLVFTLSAIFGKYVSVGEWILISGDFVLCFASIYFTCVLKIRRFCTRDTVLFAAKLWGVFEVIYIICLCIQAADCLKPGIYSGAKPKHESTGEIVAHWICYWADLAVVFTACHNLCTLYTFIGEVKRAVDDDHIFRGSPDDKDIEAKIQEAAAKKNPKGNPMTPRPLIHPNSNDNMPAGQMSAGEINSPKGASLGSVSPPGIGSPGGSASPGSASRGGSAGSAGSIESAEDQKEKISLANNF